MPTQSSFPKLARNLLVMLAVVNSITILPAVFIFISGILYTQGLEGDEAQAAGMGFGILLALFVFASIVALIINIIGFSFLLRKYSLSGKLRMISKVSLIVSIILFLLPGTAIIVSNIINSQ